METIKILLTLLLVNPVTHVERNTYVVVDTQEQCEAMKKNALSAEVAKMRREHHPGASEVKAAKCNVIDLGGYEFPTK